jgi:hypothetical protein
VSAAYDSDVDHLMKCGEISCPCFEDERYTMPADKHAAMVARLRALAEELRWANELYNYHREFGMWNPANASYEATYLATHP